MSSRPRHSSVLGVAALLVACSSAGDYQPVVDNPKLQAWCGAHPCEWTTRGDTKRVGTWHPDDYAIELVGDDSAVTQVNADISNVESRCFAFSLTADISADSVSLELDFLDDGEVDFSLPLPALHWERKTFDIATPSWYHGVRFIVHKQGPGHAVVAQLEVENKGTNCGGTPIPLGHRPAGAPCANDDECEMQDCIRSICGGVCNSVSNCRTGEVCGAILASEQLTNTCTAINTLRLGAPCSVAAQCENGACSDGVCSECMSGTNCLSSGKCERSKLQLPDERTDRGLPYQCNPGQHLRKARELCTADADCESGACGGVDLRCALHKCDDTHSNCTSECIQSLVVPGTCR